MARMDSPYPVGRFYRMVSQEDVSAKRQRMGFPCCALAETRATQRGACIVFVQKLQFLYIFERYRYASYHYSM